MPVMDAEKQTVFVREEHGWRCTNCGTISNLEHPVECSTCHRRRDGKARWWRYIVLRGDGIPADMDGRWYDLEDIYENLFPSWDGATFHATNRWEQRDDGAVAVVYEWRRQP